MTFALPSDTTPSSFWAPSEGRPSHLQPPLPSILILNVDQTLPQKDLQEALEACGLLFHHTKDGSSQPYACFSKAIASVNAPLAQPSQFNDAKQALQHELRTLHGIHLVLAVGISSHITLMEACGITLNRQSFHSKTLIYLPDGLLVAHLPTPIPGTSPTKRLAPLIEAFEELLPDIQRALAFNA